MKMCKLIKDNTFKYKKINLSGNNSYLYKNCIFIKCEFIGKDNLSNFYHCKFVSCSMDKLIYRRITDPCWSNKWHKNKFVLWYYKLKLIFKKNLVD